MSNSDWITDRPPTKADADADGEVLAHLIQSNVWSTFVKWYEVPADSPWRHTSTWDSAPTTIPRLFTSITHADGRYLALADDGTAWFNYGDARGWQQLEPLPAREVGQ